MTPRSITPVACDSILMPWPLQKTFLRARIVAGTLVGLIEVYQLP